MKLVIYSVVLNQHQAPLADELWNLTHHDFVFVELSRVKEYKGGAENYTKRPYLLQAWSTSEAYSQALLLARTAECCIFSGVDALPFQKERMRLRLLSFDMSERWLKHGWKNLLSPRLLRWLSAYYLGGWYNKPLYKLSISKFSALDHYRLGTFRGKCYKWGYFTRIEDIPFPEHRVLNTFSGDFQQENAEDVSFVPRSPSPIQLMWCGRFINWKHPELAILLAHRLKKKGVSFQLHMYGDGEKRSEVEDAVKEFRLMDVVNFHGNVTNVQVREAMKASDIFLFTSDRKEGWGAVANESLSCGCVLVASDVIGSSSYIIKDEYNGLQFLAPSTKSSVKHPDFHALDDMEKKVFKVLEDKGKMRIMQKNAVEHINRLWSPRRAAENLLQLIEELKNGHGTPIVEGPCSKA